MCVDTSRQEVQK